MAYHGTTGFIAQYDEKPPESGALVKVVALMLGILVPVLSIFALLLIWIDKIWITRNLTLGISTVLGSIVLFSGLQLMILGVVGEYLGRLYLGHTRTPQYIVRYSTRNPSAIVVQTSGNAAPVDRASAR